MLEVRKFMTKDVITVPPDMHIYDAARLLVEYKISGLPVVDGKDNLLGIITEKDILCLLVEEDVGKDTVEHFMSKDVISFCPDDSAVKVCEFFIDNPIRRVPITENGKLVGIVSRRDIINVILNIRGKQKH
ncbi:MAG TPA: CBS domain-containing protein [Candidatus Omnitrophota bacterium]|nr:CBS domain-containing protein [Candidatus Omnitrophota bacterium]HPS20474.1 CBS domain-containing protein [Candidatus Omnitrophota bacterium]